MGHRRHLLDLAGRHPPQKLVRADNRGWLTHDVTPGYVLVFSS